MKNLWLILLLAAAVLTGCKKDEERPVVAPTTRISITQIGLDTINNRLPSTVALTWSGTSAASYVTGFKVYWGYSPLADPAATFAGISQITRRNDSTFRFRLNPNTPYSSIYFYVQAVDARGVADPNPPMLRIPIRNTPPQASFDRNNLPRANQVYVTATLALLVDDPDGSETIDSLQFRINNGPWVALPIATRYVTFMPEDPNATGTSPQNAKLYLGLDATQAAVTAPGFVLNGDNTFYLRAKDLGNAYSKIDTIGAYNVRGKQGDLLVIDTYVPTGSDNPWNVYQPILQQVYPSYDRIDLLANSGGLQPRYWNTSFRLLLGLFDKVFWYSNESLVQLALLEQASLAMQTYLRNDGKVMLSSAFTNCTGANCNTAIQRNSPLFGFIPVVSDDATWWPLGLGFRIPGNNIVVDTSASMAGTARFDTLATLPGSQGGLISSADPFQPTPDARSIYTYPFVFANGDPYNGPKTIAAARYNQNRMNLFFSSVDLHRLRGRPANLQRVFDRVLNTEFNW